MKGVQLRPDGGPLIPATGAREVENRRPDTAANQQLLSLEVAQRIDHSECGALGYDLLLEPLCAKLIRAQGGAEEARATGGGCGQRRAFDAGSQEVMETRRASGRTESIAKRRGWWSPEEDVSFGEAQLEAQGAQRGSQHWQERRQGGQRRHHTKVIQEGDQERLARRMLIQPRRHLGDSKDQTQSE